jgi:hypothetical protein
VCGLEAVSDLVLRSTYVFWVACMFNHSPRPNVNFIRRTPTSKTPDVSPAIVFMTYKPIKKGEELFICYGQESKLWFSPNYGISKSQTRGAEEEDSFSADAFLSGFDGMIETVTQPENEHERRARNVPVHLRQIEPGADQVEEPISHPLGDGSGIEVESVTIDPVVDQRITDEKISVPQDRKKDRKSAQDEKNAKFRRKEAIRNAAVNRPDSEPIKLASPLAADTATDQPVSRDSLTYIQALDRLDLAPSIQVSIADVEAIEAEERDLPEFEGEHGFAGWRHVKRVPGFAVGGEPSLDSKRKLQDLLYEMAPL